MMGFEKVPLGPWWAISLLLLCLVISWLPCQAQETRSMWTVRGRGVILRGDQSKARQRAIQSSLRQALERTVANMLEPDVGVSHLNVLKKQIYRRASQYVRSYRVVWEYPDLQQQVYRVELEVEVSIEAVTQAISRLGLSQADKGTWQDPIILAHSSKESRVACRV